jgi:hypothetical protein
MSPNSLCVKSNRIRLETCTEVNIPSPAIQIPQTQSHPNEDDLGNCSRYTESGVSDASVSAGRAEPIDELYS